eukprot:scaffold294936_cov18-Prasinocladus_malaysianus.AAC.1
MAYTFSICLYRAVLSRTVNDCRQFKCNDTHIHRNTSYVADSILSRSSTVQSALAVRLPNDTLNLKACLCTLNAYTQ